MNKTPLRYAGGKSKAIKQLLPYFNGVNKVVSPFFGGGSLECHLAGQGIEVIGSDIFKPLVLFWKHVIEDKKNFTEYLKFYKPTKPFYNQVKNELLEWEYTQDILKDWKTDYYKREPKKMIDIKVASHYFFNHNLSYGPAFLGWASSVYLNNKKWNSMIDDIENLNVKHLKINELSFHEAILNNPNEFLYLDPPYYTKQDKDNKMHAPIYPNKNIPVHHDNFNHELLRDLLKNHQGKFILCYNDCETIREYYKDFKQVFPKWNYSMSNGETRIGKFRKDGNITKQSHEILIIKD